MRRLLLLLAPLALFACKDEPKPDTTGTSRNESVKATATQPSVTATASATAHPTASAPHKICTEAPLANGRPIPPGKIDHLEAPGASPLPDRIPKGTGWTWVNFWAAWCGPCKEEIPRLKAWEEKLRQAGTPITLAFVSLDDDPRQAQKFLESQPANGLRATWWLPEGKPRSSFLSELRVKDDPQLPIQALYDREGYLRCLIDGAVEDGDYAQVASVVSRK